MKLFGLTGGLGMGKSTAAQLLAQAGVPVADTDAIARDLVQPGQPALEEIQRAFGHQYVDPEGRLLRDDLARLIFSDPSARRELERILHPRIRQVWNVEADRWRQEDQPRGVVVIPLLFETDAASEFDATICVACPTATQYQRLGERGWTATEIEQRNQAQLPVRAKMDLADYVIWNDAGLELLGAQLRRVMEL
jgi:dephospho-CoA kinase